jgi:predicted membrane-bound spermidine synthase
MSLFSHPIKKLTIAAAFGIGYTLGAKAGRERYEQIKKTAQQVKDDPRVQEAATKAEGLVRETATTIKDDPRVQDVVHRAEGLLGDATDAVKGDDLVDTAKDVATDVKAKAADVASDAADKAKHVAEQASDAGSAAQQAADEKISPLLADEHVESTDEVVYSAGPDIEESIDELAPDDERDRI